MLGMSERRLLGYENDGLDGLFDRRLDKASARRVPADRIEWVLEQYRTRHTGWTVKHFHDHLCAHHGFAWSYTWTKTTLQRAGLVSKAPRRGAHRRRRPRKPCVGKNRRTQHAGGKAGLDRLAKGLPSSLYTDRGSHYFHTPEAGGKVAKDQHTQVGRALHQLGMLPPIVSPRPAQAHWRLLIPVPASAKGRRRRLCHTLASATAMPR